MSRLSRFSRLCRPSRLSQASSIAAEALSKYWGLLERGADRLNTGRIGEGLRLAESEAHVGDHVAIVRCRMCESEAYPLCLLEGPVRWRCAVVTGPLALQLC